MNTLDNILNLLSHANYDLTASLGRLYIVNAKLNKEETEKIKKQYHEALSLIIKVIDLVHHIEAILIGDMEHKCMEEE